MKYKNLSPIPIERRRNVTQPRKVFHIFCEGGKTEPSYINDFIKSLGNVPYSINIVAPVGVAKTVVGKACEQRRRLESGLPEGSSLAESDEIWIVFDCDDEEKSYFDAVNVAADRGIRKACSNPSFELWLILHFEDFDAPDDHRVLQKKLRTLCPDYNPSSNKCVKFSDLQSKVPIAEARAANLRARRNRDGASRPETTFDHLTKALRVAAEPMRRNRPDELQGIRLFRPPASRHHKPGKKP